MRGIKRAWLNIPRKVRILLNILMMALLGFGIYLFLGSPPFTAEQRYRRAEKAHMVGPAEILAVYEPEGAGAEHLLVADDGDGVIFYLYSDVRYSSGELYYREKTGDLTVLAAPCVGSFAYFTSVLDLPIFIFDDHPDAVRAELEFTLSETVNDEYFEKTYHLESVREDPGWFHFNIHIETGSRYVDEYGFEQDTPLGAEAVVLAQFSYMCGYRDSFNLRPQPVKVRLYDQNETLIVDESIQVRCVKDIAHREQHDEP